MVIKYLLTVLSAPCVSEFSSLQANNPVGRGCYELASDWCIVATKSRTENWIMEWGHRRLSTGKWWPATVTSMSWAQNFIEVWLLWFQSWKDWSFCPPIPSIRSSIWIRERTRMNDLCQAEKRFCDNSNNVPNPYLNPFHTIRSVRYPRSLRSKETLLQHLLGNFLWHAKGSGWKQKLHDRGVLMESSFIISHLPYFAICFPDYGFLWNSIFSSPLGQWFWVASK